MAKLFSIITGIVIAIGGWFGHPFQRTVLPPPQSLPNTTSTVQNLIDVSTWKIYRSEKFGISLKTPPEWKVWNDSASNLYLTSVPKEQSIHGIGIPSPHGLWVELWKGGTCTASNDFVVDNSFMPEGKNSDVLKKEICSSAYNIDLGLYNSDPLRDKSEAILNQIVASLALNTPATTTANEGILTGKVTIGPICPVERVDEPCPVSPETYTSREVIVYEEDGTTVVQKMHFDSHGGYSFALPAGTYILDTPNQIGMRGSGLPKTVVVKAGETTTVNFDIDTGIR